MSECVLESSLNRPQIQKMKLQADSTAMTEWIFPLNKAKRDYQFNIVKHSLFENCLVAIPTGVGKTFIAGCVMLNCEYNLSLIGCVVLHYDRLSMVPGGENNFRCPYKAASCATN